MSALRARTPCVGAQTGPASLCQPPNEPPQQDAEIREQWEPPFISWGISTPIGGKFTWVCARSLRRMYLPATGYTLPFPSARCETPLRPQIHELPQARVGWRRRHHPWASFLKINMKHCLWNLSSCASEAVRGWASPLSSENIQTVKTWFKTPRYF